MDGASRTPPLPWPRPGASFAGFGSRPLSILLRRRGGCARSRNGGRRDRGLFRRGGGSGRFRAAATANRAVPAIIATPAASRKRDVVFIVRVLNVREMVSFQSIQPLAAAPCERRGRLACAISGPWSSRSISVSPSCRPSEIRWCDLNRSGWSRMSSRRRWSNADCWSKRTSSMALARRVSSSIKSMSSSKMNSAPPRRRSSA